MGTSGRGVTRPSRKEEVMSIEEDVEILRYLLWLNHGHGASVYGDDGEMQCSSAFLSMAFSTGNALRLKK